MFKTRNGETIETRIDPLSVTIPGACAMTGLGRSKIYELMDGGEIRTVKVGKRRLVMVASLRDFLERRAAGRSGV